MVKTLCMYFKYEVNGYSGASLLGTLWNLDFSPITEVSSLQRSLNTLQYYTGTQNGVLITEVSAIMRFVIERFPCILKHFQIHR